MTRMTRRPHATRVDIFKVCKVLEPVIETDPSKGPDGRYYVRYAQGWNDQRVSDATGLGFDQVGRIRLEVFGQLKPLLNDGAKNNIYTSLLRRIEALEQRLDKHDSAATQALKTTHEAANRALLQRFDITAGGAGNGRSEPST